MSRNHPKYKSQIDLGVTLTVFEVEMLGWNNNCCRERHTFIEVTQ